ncbi:MAG: hypothetical protein DRJ26_05575, partial [Candidatus Methanomethylicota archaeon]
MVNKLLLSIIPLFALYLLTPIHTSSLPRSLMSGALIEFLAPPYSDVDVYSYSRGVSQALYSYSLSLGRLESFAKSMKGFGSLSSESEVTVILIREWLPDFNGKVVEIEVTYSLKGFLYVEAASNPNTYTATSQVYFCIEFGSNRFVLESANLDLYGSGSREQYFNMVNQVKRFAVQMSVSKGERILLRVILYVKAGTYGALEDYSFATSDFYSGNFGATISVKIYYQEETLIEVE